MHWNRKTIVDKIQELHRSGYELNYASAEEHHLNLVRAAAWHFGTWQRAVESAGIEYSSLLKYQRWSRERVIARIRELHAAGEDLNWRSVSTRVDPALAAAALRCNGITSWRDAITAAGLDIEEVARYKHWTDESVIAAIKARHKSGHSLSSKSMQETDQSLFCAARRRFGSWDDALAAAGFNALEIRRRRQHGFAGIASPTSRLTTTKKPAPKTTGAKTQGRKSGKLAADIKPATKNSGKTTARRTATVHLNGADRTTARPVKPKGATKGSTRPAAAKAATKTRTKTATGNKASATAAKPARTKRAGKTHTRKATATNSSKKKPTRAPASRAKAANASARTRTALPKKRGS